LTPFCELYVAAEVMGIKDCLKVLEAVAAEGMAAIGAKRAFRTSAASGAGYEIAIISSS